MSDLERLGGIEGVRVLTRAFVDRMFDDFIIGFLFEGASRERVAWHELEITAKHFGADIPYTGRNLGTLHKPRKINQGQFRRRMAILRHVLRENDVPDDLIESWVAHQERFRTAVTVDMDCSG